MGNREQSEKKQLFFKNFEQWPHNFRVYAWWNVLAKRFKICHIFGIPKSMYVNFCFSFHATYFIFPLMNTLVYVDNGHRPGHLLGEKIKGNEMKKKPMQVFVFQKYGKFWSVSLGHLIKHKLLIFEMWGIINIFFEKLSTCFYYTQFFIFCPLCVCSSYLVLQK